jgi:drug/metabolite transporter (DMT)-like permease
MTRRGFLLFAAMCVIWGIPYFLIRIAVGELSPAVLVFGRTLIGTIILLPVALATGGLKAIGRAWPAVLAFAFFEIGGPWLMLSNAEQHITSSLAGLLVSCVPLLGIVIAPIFGNRERLGPLGFVGLGVGLAGVAAIVGLDWGASDPTALVEMALVTVGYAVGPAIVRRYLGGVPAVAVNGVSLAACALVYAPFALTQLPSAVPSGGVIASVVVLGVVCTAAAFLLFFQLIREVGPVRSTVITYINPAVAAAVGILFLHEQLTVGMAVGFVLVLTGCFLATRKHSPAAVASGDVKPNS